MSRLATALAGALILSLSVAARADANVVADPTLDTELGAWEPFGGFGVTATWSPVDRNQDPGSGSLRGTLPATTIANSLPAASQCVVLQPNHHYDFVGSVLLPAATTPAAARARFDLEIHSNDGCFGNLARLVTTASVNVVDAWTDVETRFDAGPDIRSARIVLRLTAPADTTFTAHFDDIFLRVPDAVHADSFE